jgi:hypothetical protein
MDKPLGTLGKAREIVKLGGRHCTNLINSPAAVEPVDDRYGSLATPGAAAMKWFQNVDGMHITATSA